MTYDDIVIGAGISGLGYAHYKAKKGANVLVIEKADYIGGLCHSVTFDLDASFWLEMGAHTLYNSYGCVIELIEELGLKDKLVKRQKRPFLIYESGKIRSLFRYINPFSFVLGIIMMPFKDKKGKTVQSFYGRLFGRGNYKRILSDCFNAVLSQDASAFPAEFLFNKKERNKAYPRSFTLEGGISSLACAIVMQKSFSALFNHQVKSIQFLDNKWHVQTDGDIFKSKHLTIATDVKSASYLLNDVMPKLSELLSTIDLSTIYSVGVIFKKKDLNHFKEVAGLIGKNAPFYSMISRDVVEDKSYRGFVFHFKPNIFEEKEAYLEFIFNLLKVNKDLLIHSFFKDNQVPMLTINHKEKLKEINQSIKNDHLSLTGNYFKRLAIEDCLSYSKSIS